MSGDRGEKQGFFSKLVRFKAPKRENDKIIFVLVTGLARSGTTIMSDIVNEHPKAAIFSEYPFDELVKKVDSIFDYYRTVVDYVAGIEAQITASAKDEDETEDKLVGKTADGAARTAVDEPIQSDDGLSLLEKAIKAEVIKPSKADLFRLSRDSSIQLRHSERAPKPELLKPLLENIFTLSSEKNKLSVIGCKTPNYFDLGKISYLMDKLGDIRIVLMVRRPYDIVNSSIDRRNKTLKGADSWVIREMEAECGETLAQLMECRALIERFPDRILLVPYEAMAHAPREQAAIVSDFLALKPPLDFSIFSAMPAQLRGHALTAEEEEVYGRWFGHLDPLWPSLKLAGRVTREVVSAVSCMAPLVARGSSFEMGIQSSRCLLLTGWSITEPWGVWSDGPRAAIAIAARGGDRPEQMRIIFTLTPARGGDFEIHVRCNGSKLGKIDLEAEGGSSPGLPARPVQGGGAMEVVLPLHYRAIHGLNVCELLFEIEGVVSPAAAGLVNDARELGLGLMQVRFV